MCVPDARRCYDVRSTLTSEQTELNTVTTDVLASPLLLRRGRVPRGYAYMLTLILYLRSILKRHCHFRSTTFSLLLSLRTANHCILRTSDASYSDIM